MLGVDGLEGGMASEFLVHKGEGSTMALMRTLRSWEVSTASSNQ